MKLSLFEEPVPPTGGSKAEAAKRVLGTPSMGPITVVLREAVQNSWDARKESEVSFGIHHLSPDQEQKRILLENVFPDQPGKSKMREAISSPDFSVIVFSDCGTTGLDGPVAADVPPEPPDAKRNFVDFMFEIGRDSGKQLAGGTYGFGKSSFFLLSELSTVCVFTKCRHNGAFEERLMAAHLGQSTPGRTTGRAWWGVLNERGRPEPCVGAQASELAAKIGFTAFPEERCGTAIMVFAPRLGSRDTFRPIAEQGSREEIIQSLGSSMVQWFWPKMMPDSRTGRPQMSFTLKDGQSEVQIPAPSGLPPFSHFVEALAAIESFKKTQYQPPAGRVYEISSQSPKAFIGHLCLLKRPKQPRSGIGLDHEEESSRELADQARHVALMREPKLVVRYLQGAKPISEKIDVVGVFLVDKDSQHGEVERAFALSEPPVHDDWVSASLEARSHKIYVNTALKRIRERLGEFLLPLSDSGVADLSQPGLGAFSEMMGGLLLSASGTSARNSQDKDSSGNGGGGGGSQSKAKLVISGSRLEQDPNEGIVVVAPFRIEGVPVGTRTEVTGTAMVLLETGVERDPPSGSSAATFRRFELRNSVGDVLETASGNRAMLTANDTGIWHAVASVPEDSRVRVILNLER